MSYSSLLFFGDIVGRPGREALKTVLSDREKFLGQFGYEKDENELVVVNCENASHGFGLTQKNHDELISYGVDLMTSGNHIWDKKDIYQYIDNSPALIRPYNYHKTARGVGYREIENVIVINLLGKTFMQPVNCPFQAIEELSEKLNFENKIVIVDYHGEATAEKISFAKYASKFGVKAVIGTHTHVQTADEKIIDNSCAYISDVGFTGAYDSVIGMDYESSIKRLVTAIPERFDVAQSDITQVNAVKIIFENNLPCEIKRFNFTYENQKEGAN